LERVQGPVLNGVLERLEQAFDLRDAAMNGA
jgi:hypothetical protein